MTIYLYSYIINTKKIPFIHNHCGCPTAIHLMTLMVFILSFESHKYRNDNTKYLQYLIFLSQFIYIQFHCFPLLFLFKKKADYTVKFSAGIRSKNAADYRLCRSQTFWARSVRTGEEVFYIKGYTSSFVNN